MLLFQWIYWWQKISILFEISQYHTCFHEGCSYFKKQLQTSEHTSIIFFRIFEKLLQKHLFVLFHNILLKHQHGFRKRVWHADLLINDARVIEKCHWQKQRAWSIDNRPVKSIGLSWSRFISHKTTCLWINVSFLNLRQDYLSRHKQKPKVGFFFSTWKYISSEVLQGPILGPLLFSTFMCGMLLILKTVYFTGYAYYNTLFAVADISKM